LLDREGAWGLFYSVSSEEPILEQRRQKRSQITDEQDQEISQSFLNFQTTIDNARPLGSKLYSQG